MSDTDRKPPSGRARVHPARRLARSLSAFLVVLQSLVLVGGPLLDASIESASARTVVHIEGLNGAKCAAVHVGDCLICRTVSDRLTPAPPAAALPMVVAMGGVPPESVVAGRTSYASRAQRSRAPPLIVRHAQIA